MTGKERLIVTPLVEGLCESSLDAFSIKRFKEHVEPLNIQAKGKVLIIGPGEAMEEIAVIEPEIVTGDVTNIEVIGGNPLFARQIIKAWPENYPKISVSGLSYGHLADKDPRPGFDTIMFIGTPLSHPQVSLDTLSQLLEPKGSLYITVNGNPPASLCLPNCEVKIIPKIPPNPNYNLIPNYYGLVIERK